MTTKAEQPKQAKKAKALRLPTKTTINLARHENRKKNTLTLVVGVVLIAALAVAAGKFGVVDQYARLSRAQEEYNAVHEQYLASQEAVSRYDQVQMEYRTYSMQWMDGDDTGKYVTVDRQTVLELVEDQLMTSGTVSSFQVVDDTLYASMSGMDLEEISLMFARLQQSPIVSSVSLGQTQTDSDTGDLSFSVTIQLQAGEQEAAQ